MMKKLLAVVTALCLLLVTGLALAETEPVSVYVDLEGNPTTGYEWYAKSENEAVVTVSGEYTAEETADGLTGVGGTYSFVISGVAEGDTSVVFSYARSWENEAVSVITYTVHVDADLSVNVLTVDAVQNDMGESDETAEEETEETEAAEETDDTLDFTVTLDEVPEGYTDDWTAVDGVQYIIFTADNKPTYVASVCADEYFQGYTLNTADLSDEELQEMEDYLSEGFNQPSITLSKTSNGTDVLIVDEPDEGADGDYVSVLTIYQGYVFSVDAYAEAELTDADVELAVSIMSSLWVNK